MNRSGVLPKKETMRLIEGLRKQGCKIRRMKKGYRVEFPNGGSTMLHLTNSDSRGTLNTRAEIKRAGLTYPGEEKRERTMKTLATDTNEKLEAVLKRIDEGGFYGSVQEMADDAGVHLVTLIRRLKDRGWTNQRAKGHFIWYAPGAAPEGVFPAVKKDYKHPRNEYLSERSKAIVALVNAHPEGISAADVSKELNIPGDSVRVYLARALEFGRITRPERGVYAPLGVEPTYPEINKAKSLAQTDGVGRGHERLTFDPPAKNVQPNGKGTWPLVDTSKFTGALPPEAKKLLDDAHREERPMTDSDKAEFDALTGYIAAKAKFAAPAPAEGFPGFPVTEREFIDSVDSWTIPVPAKLQRMAEQMGLKVEVRVWRH